ncbi:MAG TPA: hypothetical protein VE912_22545 [Bacteroidales bacterium]|nr:hypothetical protein [Bacteroidales bacterium]
MNDELKVKDLTREIYEPISIDTPINKAKSIMALNDYSQLAVVDKNKKHIKAISWKSIGKAELMNKTIKTVRDCLEESVFIDEEKPIVKYLKLTAKKEYIFVRSTKSKLTDKLSGIITTYDLIMRFNDFLKPYMELWYIEDALRDIIKKRGLVLDGVKKSLPPEEAKDDSLKINELSFSEYLDIIGHKENWEKIDLNGLDRKEFIKSLDSIRVTRNKVAHFKSSLSEEEKYHLEVIRELLLEI